MHLDEITGSFKKDCFEQFLDIEIKRSTRHLWFFSYFIMRPDITWNGSNDLLLKMISQIVFQEVRGTDIMGRVGNSKFSLILHQADGSGALNVGERIRTRIENFHFPGSKKEKKVTVSMGGACFPSQANDRGHLTKKAEENLNKAMDMGGNMVLIDMM